MRREKPRSKTVIRRELREVNARIDALYWTYTRCARGVPPCVADPEIYARRRALEDELRIVKKRHTPPVNG